MSNGNALVIKALGLNTQPNELAVPEGSLSVAENVEITRDGVVQVSAGFEDLSTNMPDFEPQQLFAYGGVLYAHTDEGWWYYDTSSSMWLRKAPGSSGNLLNPHSGKIYSGTFYFACNNAVLQANLSTGVIALLAGNISTTGTTDGTGAAARFNYPADITFDGSNYYICDYTNHTIRKMTTAGVVTTFAGSAGVSGTTDASGGSARFNLPYGITNDGTNLWVCDSGNHTIRKIVISSAAVTTFAGTAGATGTTNGTGSAARFNEPVGIVLSGSDL
jgi:hypothetical protein